MRRPAGPPDPELLARIKERSPENEGWKTYSCKLVTPMYGGGVKPGDVDLEMPIRASSIRGQLRFWWRVACCPQAVSPAEMFKKESAIWGGIGDEVKASKVEVRVVTEFFVERVQGCGQGKYRQQEQAKAPKIERDNSPGMSRYSLM